MLGRSEQHQFVLGGGGGERKGKKKRKTRPFGCRRPNETIKKKHLLCYLCYSHLKA